MPKLATPLTLGLATLLACSGAPHGVERPVPPATPGARADIVMTTLSFDVAAKTATAIIDFEVLPGTALTLESGDLEIVRVLDANGPLAWTKRADMLDIGVPAGTKQVRIDYRYRDHYTGDGALSTGSTRTWPRACGNLFPCNSSPQDGAKYRLALSGLTPDQVGIYPQNIAVDVPAYMIAWAFGEFEYTALGTTSAGTEVGIYFRKEARYPMQSGTYSLVRAFEFFETKLGAYPFGNKAAAVQVDWPITRFAALEVHPYWHVATEAIGDPNVHIHEAAHGWYGNGVRMRCWEDLVLSEGVVSYLTNRAVEETMSQWNSNRLWQQAEASVGPGVVWPKGCNETPVESFTSGVYSRGALFFREVEVAVGRDILDGALASFFAKRVGTAASFGELLDHIKDVTGVDVLPCAEAWLRSDTRDAASAAAACVL